MKIPSNGKVLVFDDKYEQIKGLLKSLSQEKIPYLYYQDETGNDLPSSPVKNVRLVFLDLQLVSDQNFSEENVVSSIGARFAQAIEPNSPYILIYWSTKAKRYQKILEQSFENRLADFKPLASFSLKKSEALSSTNPVEFIKNELKQITEEYSSYYAMGLWETAVNDAAGSITGDLINIFDKKKDWDKNFKNLMFSLALAEIGNSHIDKYSDEERLKTAIGIINTMLIDSIDLETDKIFSDSGISNVKQGGSGLNADIKVKLNTKLHLLKDIEHKALVTGNLYLSDCDEGGEKIIRDNFKASKLDDIFNSEIKPLSVLLDVTPACDYAQKKEYTRILHGVAVSGLFNKGDLSKSYDYLYRECPILFLNQKRYLLFDFRYLDTIDSKEVEKWTSKVRLRLNLVLDIQAQLSNHFNRPGIINI